MQAYGRGSGPQMANDYPSRGWQQQQMPQQQMPHHAARPHGELATARGHYTDRFATGTLGNAIRAGGATDRSGAREMHPAPQAYQNPSPRRLRDREERLKEEQMAARARATEVRLREQEQEEVRERTLDPDIGRRGGTLEIKVLRATGLAIPRLRQRDARMVVAATLLPWGGTDKKAKATSGRSVAGGGVHPVWPDTARNALLLTCPGPPPPPDRARVFLQVRDLSDDITPPKATTVEDVGDWNEGRGISLSCEVFLAKFTHEPGKEFEEERRLYRTSNAKGGAVPSLAGRLVLLVKWLPREDIDDGGRSDVDGDTPLKESAAHPQSSKQTTIATSELEEMRLRLAQLERREQERRRDEQRKVKEHLTGQFRPGVSAKSDMSCVRTVATAAAERSSDDTKSEDATVPGTQDPTARTLDEGKDAYAEPDAAIRVDGREDLAPTGDPSFTVAEREAKLADAQRPAPQPTPAENVHVENACGRSHGGDETKSEDNDAEPAEPAAKPSGGMEGEAPRASSAQRDVQLGRAQAELGGAGPGAQSSEKDTHGEEKEQEQVVEKNQPKLSLPADPAMWGVADVSAWIRGQCTSDAEMGRIGAAFADAEVDGDMLLELDDECLQELGVSPAPLRMTMLAGIRKLVRHGSGFATEMVPTVAASASPAKKKKKKDKKKDKKKQKKKIRRGRGIKS